MNFDEKGKKRHSRNIIGAVFNRATRISIIGILAILFVVASSVTKSTASDKAAYNIGGIISITGRAAYWGTTLSEGEEFTVKQWMKRGGIKGYPINYVRSDDECKPDRALVIVKKLVTKDSVLAIVAGGLTPCVTAISPYLNQVGVPFIFSAGGKTYSLPKEQFMFGVLPNTPLVVDYKLKWLKNRGVTRVAMIAESSAYGEENVAYTPGAAKRAGMDLVEVGRYGLEDLDMTAMLTHVKAKNPEGIIMAGADVSGVRVIKQMATLGIDVPILLPVAAVEELFLKNLGSVAMGKTNIYADGNYLMALDTVPDTDPRKMRSMSTITEFEKEYGKKFEYGHGVGHDKVDTICRAIEAVAPPADKIDYRDTKQLNKIRAEIRTWLENAQGLQLLTGAFSRSPEDHIGTKDVGMVRIIDKEWRIVD